MNFYRSIISFLLLSFGAFLLSSCGSGDTEPSALTAGEPYTVVCTVGMITDIVRNVAGEHAQVEGIIGEGVDPHLYKP